MKEDNEGSGVLILIGIIIFLKALVFFSIFSITIYLTWNQVLAKTLTFVTPMTSFWQPILLGFFLELIIFGVFYRLAMVKGQKKDE